MGRIAIASLSDVRRFGAPAIWPNGRTREAIFPAFPIMTMEGWVTVELIHGRTGFVKRRLYFKNMVTDAALNSFGTVGSSAFLIGNYLRDGYLGVGTGNAAPAVTDTGLQTPTGVRTNSVGGGGTPTNGWGAANAYSFIRVVREFSEAQSNGNLTEFGMFRASAGDIMLARQLFKDVGGAPTVITKTSDDKLRVTYEFRMYPPTVDSAGVVNVSGTNYNYTGRAINVGVDSAWGYGGAVGMLQNFGNNATNGSFCVAGNYTALSAATGGGPTGATATANSDTNTKSAYTTGSFLSEWTHVWNPGTANFTGGTPGVRGFVFQPWSSANSFTHQMLLSTHIPKVNTQRLTMVFRCAWGRH